MINLFVLIVIVGVALWLVNTFIPMDARIKQLLTVAAIIIIVIAILQVLLGGGFAMPVVVR